MRPKEVQQILGIDADRIKLYKREGVFAPENPPSGNRGTNYTETDLENLRFLVVLTKSGLTCSDIREIQCPYCGGVLEIDLEDYQYDQSNYERENGMGPDIVYSFDSEDNIECLSCEGKFKVSGWIREYPVGAYDSEDIDVEKILDEN